MGGNCGSAAHQLWDTMQVTAPEPQSPHLSSLPQRAAVVAAIARLVTIFHEFID